MSSSPLRAAAVLLQTFVIVLASAAGASAADAAPATWDETPQQAYVSAVARMRSLANPPYATYESDWHSTGLGFDFEEDDGKIVIDVGFGRAFANQREFSAAYRAADRQLQLSDANGRRFFGKGRVLEPTWAGAYDLLRYGLRGNDVSAEASPDAAAPESPNLAASAPPAAGASAPPDLANIATVSAISPLFYRVSDEGSRTCPGLGDGRALHLTARKDVGKHPLTDVVLDPATGRFCSMTFVIKDSGIAGVTGHYTINFSPFGAYWLVSDGTIDVDVRFFGIAAKHATLQWTIADVATPERVPDAAFEGDAPSPAPPKRR